MLVIPLSPVPNQTLTVLLAAQNCKLNIYTKTTGLFLDLYVGNNLILAGAICLDRTLIVRDKYHKFSGDLAVFDLQGTSDPDISALGNRWVLAYLTPSDL